MKRNIRTDLVADIEVVKSGETDKEFSFEVTARDNQGTSSHSVTLSREDLDRLAGDAEEPEHFIHRCFRFLLERESKESILSNFDVSVIGKYFPDFEQTIEGRPRGVVAVVMRGAETLVVQRAPDVEYPGYMTPLSGKVEDGEDEHTAVVREVLEEVGLQVRPIRHVWTCQTEDGVYDLRWWLAEYVAGELVLKADEVSSAIWITPSDFRNLKNTFADDRKFYAEVFPELPEVKK